MPAARLIIETIPRMSPARAPRRRSPITSRHAALYGCKLADRHHVQIKNVEERVDDDDSDRAEGRGARNVAPWIANLLGDIGGGVPARVGEHHRDQCEQPGRSAPRGRRRRCRLALEPAPIEKPRAMNISSAEHLERGKNVHPACAPARRRTMCTNAKSPIATIATSVCRENVNGTNGSGTTKNGVVSDDAWNEPIEIKDDKRSRLPPSRR